MRVNVGLASLLGLLVLLDYLSTWAVLSLGGGEANPIALNSAVILVRLLAAGGLVILGFMSPRDQVIKWVLMGDIAVMALVVSWNSLGVALLLNYLP